MIENLRGEHKLALGTHKVILSLAVIMYHLWMIQFVYYKWGHHLVAHVVFQATLTATIATYILHATYQMDTIFANLHAQENEVPDLSSEWSAYVSITFNVLMPVHVITVVTAHAAMEWSLRTILVLILVGCEFYHRCLAIYTFLRLLRVMYTRRGSEEKNRIRNDTLVYVLVEKAVPQTYPDGILLTGFEDSRSENASYLSCCVEETALDGHCGSVFVSQDFIPRILAHGKLVTGYENYFQYLKNQS